MLSPSLCGRLLAAAAVGAAFVAVPKDAMACSTQPLIGSLCTVAIRYCPKNYLPADGRTLTIASNQQLYALIGYLYGGDGGMNFKLPDLRGRVAVGAGTGLVNPSAKGADPTPLKAVGLGEQRGAEGVVLTADQTPLHSHQAMFSGAFPPNTELKGSANIPTLTVIPAQTVSGTATVGGLNSVASPAVGTGQANPDATHNYIGKAAGGSTPNMFYGTPASTANFPTGTVSVTIPAQTVSGMADGPITLSAPGTNISGVVTVAPTPVPKQPVPTLDPGLGLIVCIAVEGIWPDQQ